LTEEERSVSLNPLLKAGWTVVEGRDAIYRELKFKNFNEVKIQSDLALFLYCPMQAKKKLYI